MSLACPTSIQKQCAIKPTVRTVPHGVRGSGVPVRSSADTGEGFGEVIDQHPETPSMPSTCRRTEWTEIQSPGPRQIGQSTEYGGWRSDGARVREDKEIDSEYGVTGVPRGNRDNVTRYPN